MKACRMVLLYAAFTSVLGAEAYGQAACTDMRLVETETAVAAADSVLSSRPLPLFFSPSWCGTCRAVCFYTFRDAETERLLGRMEVKFLDVDESHVKGYKKEAAERCVPELVLLDRCGNGIGTLAGYRKDVRETVAFLKAAFTARESARIEEGEALPPLQAGQLHAAHASSVSPGRMPLGMRLCYSRLSAERFFPDCVLGLRQGSHRMLSEGDGELYFQQEIGGGSRSLFRISRK